MQDRFIRQADLVPHQRLAEVTPVVIGVGAGGRPVAMQLAAIGANNVQLYDHDTVEDVNVATQGYAMREIGNPKVMCVQYHMQSLNPEATFHAHPRKFRSNDLQGLKNPVVFSCVDCIVTRGHIFRACKRFSVPLMVDGRMIGELLQVLSATRATWKLYEKTLFPPGEAQQARCTARSTIYAATIAAGLMIHQFTRWLRDIELDPQITLNLLGSEIYHA